MQTRYRRTIFHDMDRIGPADPGKLRDFPVFIVDIRDDPRAKCAPSWRDKHDRF